MVVPLDRPVQNQRPLQAYELHQFGDDGQIRTTAFICARCNADVQHQARLLTDGLRAERGFDGRLIDTLAPGDRPIAGVISLEVRT